MVPHNNASEKDIAYQIEQLNNEIEYLSNENSNKMILPGLKKKITNKKKQSDDNLKFLDKSSLYNISGCF